MNSAASNKAAADDAIHVMEATYRLLTAVAALYDTASSADGRPQAAADWTGLIESLLFDVGKVHELLDRLQRRGGDWRISGKGTGRGLSVMQLLQLTQGRFDRVMKLGNVWTDILRWIRILQLCEQRWAKVIQRFERWELDSDGVMVRVKSSSQHRRESLTAIGKRIAAERQKHDQLYKLPPRLVA